MAQGRLRRLWFPGDQGPDNLYYQSNKAAKVDEEVDESPEEVTDDENVDHVIVNCLRAGGRSSVTHEELAVDVLPGEMFMSHWKETMERPGQAGGSCLRTGPGTPPGWRTMSQDWPGTLQAGGTMSQDWSGNASRLEGPCLRTDLERLQAGGPCLRTGRERLQAGGTMSQD
ncbi:hypothetical protein WMY93_024346 [Mugilogobius chulae]|uniref:Uncharacterized protein n=1 Tax=Mugilogobius chulae TaxID=88201 RepID=A0AAW0NBZ1_9GOBI